MRSGHRYPRTSTLKYDHVVRRQFVFVIALAFIFVGGSALLLDHFAFSVKPGEPPQKIHFDNRTVTALSKSWIVTLRVEGTYTKAGTTIPATVTIDNRTGHSVNITGCPEVIYKIVLGNFKIPNSPVNTSALCVSKMSPGVHVFRTKVQTTYQACGGGGYPPCGNPPNFPRLPTGTYRTQVVLPGTIPSLPKLGSLSITIHSWRSEKNDRSAAFKTESDRVTQDQIVQGLPRQSEIVDVGPLNE